MRFAYADPPYPGLAYLYRNEASYAGEVDHSELVRSLMDGYDGWALSTSARALRLVLPICPAGVRVCAWVKPQPPHVRTRGIHNLWEPLLVMGGRQVPPGRSDWLRAKPARGGGHTLIGRKPLAFAAWLFDLLGMLPGDSLDDRFPGTGMIGRAWCALSSGRVRKPPALAGLAVGPPGSRPRSGRSERPPEGAGPEGARGAG